MKKAGILGGSFDPIHIGHIQLAKSAIQSGLIDEVFFIPAFQAPLRDANVVASSADRVAMLEIALVNFPYPYEIQLCEINRGDISYAIDTITYLKSQYANRNFKWIIGSDHISKLHKWKDVDKLTSIVSFICGKRDEFSSDITLAPKSAKIEFFDFEPMPHSSTIIRNKILANKKNIDMLDKNVENYIYKNKLYICKTDHQ